MAIAGLVLGIIAIVTCLVPIVNNISMFISILGIVFSAIGIKKHGGAKAVVGLVISILSIVGVLVSQTMYSQAIDKAMDTTPNVAQEQAATDTSGHNADTLTSDPSDVYEIVDTGMTDDGYSKYITGTFTNKSDNQISAIITYNIYDSTGAMVSNAYDSVNNLAPGATYNIKAYTGNSTDDIASYEVTEVNAF